jgi:hypothetical protein
MRPTYETAANRAEQAAIVARVAERWRVTPKSLPHSMTADYLFLRPPSPKPVAVAEIKARRYSLAELERLGGFFMSTRKWSGIVRYCEGTKTPFALIVSFAGDLRAAVFKPGEFPALPTRKDGRRDRGDRQDVEIVSLFPGELFSYTFD